MTAKARTTKKKIGHGLAFSRRLNTATGEMKMSMRSSQKDVFGAAAGAVTAGAGAAGSLMRDCEVGDDARVASLRVRRSWRRDHHDTTSPPDRTGWRFRRSTATNAQTPPANRPGAFAMRSLYLETMSCSAALIRGSS